MNKAIFKGFHKDGHGEEEIILRGEHIRGEWAKGFLKTYDSGISYINDLMILPETIVRYSATQDANGRPLFEGDVVGGLRGDGYIDVASCVESYHGAYGLMRRKGNNIAFTPFYDLDTKAVKDNRMERRLVGKEFIYLGKVFDVVRGWEKEGDEKWIKNFVKRRSSLLQ